MGIPIAFTDIELTQKKPKSNQYKFPLIAKVGDEIVGFTKIQKLPDTGFLKVEVERPSMDQLDAWAIECDRHVSSALSRSGKIKVDALSQIAKGVKNEFIEPVVAHRARLQLDDLSLS